jgi:O-antigen/teichoic acid export membrane protein
MIRLLGKSEYGLYNTVASTISMLSVLSLGFNSSYIRYYSIYKKDNRTEEIYKLNGLFILIFSIIGIIAFIIKNK